MNSIQEVNYICHFLGLDVKNNDYIALDLAEIPKKQEFIIFMRENNNHIDLKYLNPLQKLNKLKSMFNEHINATRLQKADDESYLLAKKVRELRCQVKNSYENFRYDGFKIKSTNEPYFSKFEIQVLSKIGNIRYLLRLDDIYKLENEIYKAFKSIILTKKADNQIANKVAKMLPSGVAW